MKNFILSILAVATPLGCATTYVPATQKQAVQDGIMSATVVAIRQSTVTVRYHSENEVTLGPPRISRTAETPCNSGAYGNWEGRRELNAQGSFAFRVGVVELDAKFATLGLGPGINLDLSYREGIAEECIRLPITATNGEILWTAKPPLNQVGAGLYIDWPLLRRGGIGPGLVIEGRFIRGIGSWKGMWSFGMGWSLCTDNCPEWRSVTLFGHLDAGVQLFKRVEFGRAAVEAGAGIASKGALLLAETDHSYPGGRGAFCLAPLLAFRVLFFHAEARPGFSPPQRAASGPEITVARQFVYGRASMGQDTVVSLGWAWTGLPN